ncbi:hypothetical protein M513_07126 [Trichuris suis]|uniref:Uncharacterized protein n=1 Tax=Trichuris suis TaxID=68888 RepID=A0A085M448_9BILA|nr:hypothetical protein M513_07126 [Trichuris suis]
MTLDYMNSRLYELAEENLSIIKQKRSQASGCNKNLLKPNASSHLAQVLIQVLTVISKEEKSGNVGSERHILKTTLSTLIAWY